MAYFTPTQQWFYNPQRLQEAQMGVSAPQMMSPPMAAPMASPGIPPQMPMQEESPIVKGLSAGLGAGRESMDWDQKQKERAMGLMLFHMFSGMGNSKNPSILGSMSEGLSTGMPHLQNERANIVRLNQMEMERQDALQRELQRQREREQERGDLRQYRNEMIGLKRQEFDAKHGSNSEQSFDGLDVSSLPDLDKPTRAKYSLDYRGTGKLLEELGTIRQKMKELKKTENERGSPLVSQANPYIGKLANPVKDVAGRAIPGKMGEQLNKERLLRQSLNSRLQSFRLKAEKEIKGGVLSQGMVDRFEKMGTFPDLSQGYDTVETLLKDLEKEASSIHKAAGASLKTGKQVTPFELEASREEAPINGRNSAPSLQNMSDEELMRIIGD